MHSTRRRSGAGYTPKKSTNRVSAARTAGDGPPAGAFSVLAGPVAAALAHASLVSSVPSAGSSLRQSPATIVMTFGENPDPRLTLVRILDSNGRTVPGVSSVEAVPGRPLELQSRLSGGLAKGVYTINWRSVSAVDGHVDNGAFAFGVGMTPAPGSIKTVDLLYTSMWTSALSAVGRWLLYAGLALFVGAASTCILVLGGSVPAGGALVLRGAAAVAMVGLCAMVWAERALVGAQSLLPLFETTEGTYLLALGAALAVCVGAVVCVDLWPARWSLVFLGAAGVAAVLAHILAGHADAPSSLRLVNVAAQWVHMVAVGVWVGGLAWLLLGIRGMTRADRAAAVSAFSRVATVTLVVVLVTGAARGMVEVGGLSNLFGTSYGIALLVKLGLVALLVALGAVNHFRLVPAIGGDEGVTRTFRTNSRTELAVAAAVLAATAVLSGLAPASSAVAQGATAKGVTMNGSDATTTLRAPLAATPGAPGSGSDAARQMLESSEPMSMMTLPPLP